MAAWWAAPVDAGINLPVALLSLCPPQVHPAVQMASGGVTDFQSLIPTCSSNIQRITHNSMFPGLSGHAGVLLPWKRPAVRPAEVPCVLCVSPDSCSDQEFGEPAGNQAGHQSPPGQPVRK